MAPPPTGSINLTLSAHTKRNLQRNYATPVDTTRQKEYAFEMAASSIRFGPGVTKEVGMDFKNMGAKRVCVVTDKTVRGLNAMKQVEEGLSREGIEFVVYDGSRYVIRRLIMSHTDHVGKGRTKRQQVCSSFTFGRPLLLPNLSNE
jgi:hypothetical protein